MHLPSSAQSPAGSRSIALACVATLLWLMVTLVSASEWHHPFYLAGGGYWRHRVPLVVHNQTETTLAGRPVGIAIGPGGDELPIAGQAAESIRVCSAAGVEMVFEMSDAEGKPIRTGPIPAHSTLIIPVECAAQATASYFVYFDNPSAVEVPEWLRVHLTVQNGDLERGNDATPTQWTHDAGDSDHQAMWSKENPQSGTHCLKTTVAPDAEPTWIASRQAGIHIIPGAKYIMRAWVKADNVRGEAGWYIHVGNRTTPLMISPMLYGGGGSYDWKLVVAEFTAPAAAELADLGTMLRGTGTAWFDNVTLECQAPGQIHVSVGPGEQITLNQLGDAPAWYQENSVTMHWDRRGAVRLFNFESTATSTNWVAVDCRPLVARTRCRFNSEALRVTDDGRAQDFSLVGDTLFFETTVPPRSVKTYFIYFSASADTTDEAEQKTATPHPDITRLPNLVANPSFEQGETVPDAWTHDSGGQGVVYSLEPSDAPGAGAVCVKMQVPADTPETWRGWHQKVPVQPGHAYFVGGWIRCQDVDGDVHLHFHLLDSAGQQSKQNPMRSTGQALSGTADWTWISAIVPMPDDTTQLDLHLTSNAHGTLWHDGLVVTEVVHGTVDDFQCREMDAGAKVALWQVNAICKVFSDDPAPQLPPPTEIALARNEREPLQLAVRSGRPQRDVRIEIDTPRSASGDTLNNVQVNVVGYVPIDYPTNYYRSELPAWYRKQPSGQAGCDGWSGLWPDPLLPRTIFDLKANATQSIWVLVSTDTQTAAGDYRGKVRLVSDGETLAEQAFRVHVWDFTLPDKSHLTAIYDVRLGPGDKWWGGNLDDKYWELVEFLAQRRLSPDTIRPAPRLQYREGRVEADFTAFDKAAKHYFDELGLPVAYMPHQFYLFGWGHPPAIKFGEQPYAGQPPFEGADRTQLRPEFKRAYQACLKTFWDHLREKGWQDKVVLYISDEPFDQLPHIRTQMQALCRMIHEVDPAIPIYSSTWKHVPDWDDALDIWGIGHYGIVPVKKMAELRANGKRLWFTTDGQMCTDTPYCAVERLLPHYCFQYGAQAYEFWGAAWLTHNPYQFGWHAYIDQSDQPDSRYWIRYPNGDGFLIYPGPPIGYGGLVSSIRLEQAREGIEDYEYLHLMKQRIARARGAGHDVSAADQVMEQASQLVSIPNAGGRYSSKILPDPDAVLRLRLSLARAIEQLKDH